MGRTDPRPCNGCTACCTVLGVQEIGKPCGRPCTHAFADHGCARYDTRPSGCRAYSCLWSLGLLGDGDRPDVIGLVFDAAKIDSPLALGTGVQPLTVREYRPRAWDDEQNQPLLRRLAERCVIILIRGSKRTMVGPQPMVERIVQFADRHVVQ